MCGIFGSVGQIDKRLMKKAMRLMMDRGPDSQGIFEDKEIMLGIRRLSIIDLKSGGQPIFSEDRTVVTVFNGEIYNYRELRAELEKKSHRFYTETDTEVIVHSYEEYGMSFVSRLSGMFAIAIYDTKKKKLFLCRDRYGEKPLYYYNGDCFIFSSAIRPILNHDGLKPELNRDGLPHYLKYRYFRNPDTFIRQIKKIVPGTFLEINVQDNNVIEVKENKYYSFSSEKETPELDGLLADSVSLRMRSDVPVGLFLSGGLDSTTVLHYMEQSRRQNGEKITAGDEIDTFTIGFEGHDDTNELKNASQVSEHYGTGHNEVIISCQDAIRSIDKVMMALEEPISDPTAVSSYFLAKAAAKKVKVVLAGEGADEVFGGYNYYRNMQLYRRLSAIRPALMLARYIPENILDTFFSYPGGIGAEGKARLAGLAGRSDFEAYDEFITLWKDYGSLLKKKESGNFKFSCTPAKKDIYSEMLHNNLTGWLPDYILTRVDKMTMASSLECRSPFLDNRIVDSFGLKDIGKSILRKTMSKKLPGQVIRQEKFPFFTPLCGWFHEGMKEYYQELFDRSEIINKLFEKSHIDAIIGSHDKSPLISSRKLWSLLTIEKTVSALGVHY